MKFLLDYAAEFILSRSHPRFTFPSQFLASLLKRVWLNVYWFALWQSETFSNERTPRMQKKRLMTLIQRAQKTVPFFSDYLKNVHKFEDFFSIPPLTKQDLRKVDPERLINKTLGCFKVSRSTSGGSTGITFPFFHDRNMYIRRVALYHRTLRWAGRKSDDTVVWIMRERHPEFGGIPFVCFGTEDIEKRKNELYELFERKTVILHAMASHLIFVADLIEKDKKKFNFKGIISYAEPLHLEVRQYLIKRFKAPIFDLYGTQEILIQGNECEIHDGFHINTEWVFIEVLDSENKPLPPGEPGFIVMTSLDNEVMPFIRYKVGDVGYWMTERCPCGRTLPRLKIAGRDLTFFIHPNGHIGDFISIIAPILELIPKVLGFQVIRRNRFEFVINLIPTALFDESCRTFIKERVENYLGPKCLLRIEIIREIPLGPGGKPRVFVNMSDDALSFIGK